MCKTLPPAQTEAVFSEAVEKSESFPHNLRRRVTFKGSVMKAAGGGFVASIEGVRELKAWGETEAAAMWSLKLLFAEYVALSRRKGGLCGELVVVCI